MILNRYSTPQEVAEAVAKEAFLRPSEAGWAHIAVSGGSTPRLLFQILSQEPFRSAVRWENIHLYWVDERCVPPTDPDSNYGMTKEALLDHVPIPADQVHRIVGENDPEREAKDYSWLVGSELPSNGNYPVFDVVILGMGDDGHTSSIFPHQLELLKEEQPYAVGINPKGQQRIAMTGPTIMSAKKLMFHATGEKKAPILRAIVSKTPESKNYPAGYILQHKHDIAFYTDIEL